VSFHLRRYTELIDAAEFAVIETPEDIEVRYLLAFAYVATGAFESAIRILSTTGLPDSVLNDQARSVIEYEAFYTLMDALAGSGLPEAIEVAQSMARWSGSTPWWGEVGWIAVYEGCSLAILGRREAALEMLSRMKTSPRLQREPTLRDAWCFQDYQHEPAYRSVLDDQVARRRMLREQLPATLAEFGLDLP
jgi:hypothetical protein